MDIVANAAALAGGPVSGWELERFRIALETMIDAHYAKEYPQSYAITQHRVYLEQGPKFVRVVHEEGQRGNPSRVSSRSSHSFIELSTGNILKAAGWKAPEKKNPRGNIRNAAILTGCTPQGTVYLR